MKRFLLLAALLIAGIRLQADTVRVAAIQCPSRMGRTSENISILTNLIRTAAAQGAKIIVTPECAGTQLHSNARREGSCDVEGCLRKQYRCSRPGNQKTAKGTVTVRYSVDAE